MQELPTQHKAATACGQTLQSWGLQIPLEVDDSEYWQPQQPSAALERDLDQVHCPLPQAVKFLCMLNYSVMLHHGLPSVHYTLKSHV